MADSKTTAPATVADEFDRAEVSRAIGMARAELSNLVQDAKRRRPFYALSREVAVTKRDEAVSALYAFIEAIDKIKKD